MHELSIALNVLDIAAEEAERQGGARVAAIHLKLGLLSGIVKDALLSAFDLARQGSAFETSALVVEEVPVVAHCPACAADRTIDAMQFFRCPVCGATTTHIVSGRELEVVALEIET
jgi:hydrogenase nickel incorporation protein HypA/HybF